MSERTREQLHEQYVIEKELAERLRRSEKSERKRLYSTIYDELFDRVPHHPQLSRKRDPSLRREEIDLQMNWLKSLLMPDITFAEIGCGDCLLSVEVAKRVGKVYGVDVSRTISALDTVPGNFELLISDGTSIDLPPGSVDIVYSNQLIEHLHPDDAAEHLRSVYRVLAAGGRYIFSTPHRYAGPHDISKYFDTEAKGLHLHEYTLTELAALLGEIGFSRFCLYKRLGARYVRIPAFPLIVIERIIGPFPYGPRKRAARVAFRPMRMDAEK